MKNQGSRNLLPFEETRLAEAIVDRLNGEGGRAYQILSFEMGRMRGGKRGSGTFDCSLWLKEEDGEPVHLTYIGQVGSPAESRPGADRVLVAPAAGPAVLEFPEYQLRLWAYPNDPGLPGVALLESREQLAQLLESHPAWIGVSEPQIEITDLQVRRIKYVARMRASFLVTCTCRTGSSGGSQITASAFAKVVKAVNVEERFANLMAFANRVQADPGCGVLIPAIYGVDSRNGVLWQEALTGQPVTETPEQQGLLLALAPEIGRRLAAFHNLEVSLSPGYDFAHQVGEIEKTCQAMERAGVGEDFPLHQLARNLLAQAKAMDAVPPRPVHGSFKLSHVFQTEAGLYFIDCETVSAGDPAYDVGRFGAHLYKMGLQGSLAMDYVRQVIDRFTEAYLAAIRFPLSRERIRWHTVAHLVASQGLKQLKRGRSRLLPELAGLGDQLLKNVP